MQQFFAIVLGFGLLFLLWRQWRLAAKRLAALPIQLFSQIQDLLEHPQISGGEAVGTWIMTGLYKDHAFQLKAIVDSLATRKLPSLWLMITLPEPQNVKASLDLVMRPTALTSFSNFDFLLHTLQTPFGFPAHAVLRTEDPAICPSPEVLRPYLELFEGRNGKEFLVSPKGLRIVVLVAEVDRLLYGVFREANFGATVIDPELAEQCLNTLLELNERIIDPHGRKA